MANCRSELVKTLNFLREHRGTFYKDGEAVAFDRHVMHVQEALSLPMRNCDRFDGDRDGRVAAMRTFMTERERLDRSVPDGEAQRYVLEHVFEFVEWLLHDARTDVNTFHTMDVLVKGEVPTVRDLYALAGAEHKPVDGDAYKVTDTPDSVFVWVVSGFVQYDFDIEKVSWCDEDCTPGAKANVVGLKREEG